MGLWCLKGSMQIWWRIKYNRLNNSKLLHKTPKNKIIDSHHHPKRIQIRIKLKLTKGKIEIIRLITKIPINKLSLFHQARVLEVASRFEANQMVLIILKKLTRARIKSMSNLQFTTGSQEKCLQKLDNNTLIWPSDRLAQKLLKCLEIFQTLKKKNIKEKLKNTTKKEKRTMTEITRNKILQLKMTIPSKEQAQFHVFHRKTSKINRRCCCLSKRIFSSPPNKQLKIPRPSSLWVDSNSTFRSVEPKWNIMERTIFHKIWFKNKSRMSGPRYLQKRKSTLILAKKYKTGSDATVKWMTWMLLGEQLLTMSNNKLKSYYKSNC